MILTYSILEQGKSSNGGWSAAQLKLFGLTYPLKKGWKDRIAGKDFPPDVIDQFLGLQNQHIQKQPISYDRIDYEGELVCKFCGRSQDETDEIADQFEYALASDDSKEKIRADAPF